MALWGKNHRNQLIRRSDSYIKSYLSSGLTMVWFMVDITMVNGVYKPTFTSHSGHHPVNRNGNCTQHGKSSVGKPLVKLYGKSSAKHPIKDKWDKCTYSQSILRVTACQSTQKRVHQL